MHPHDLVMWGARHRRRAWLADWDPAATERFPGLAHLDADERVRLAELVEWMVLTKHWEAARGFQVTADMVTTIAAHACLLVLDLDRRAYRGVAAIVVHPRTITARGPAPTAIPGVVSDGPRRLLGQAHDRRGPVLVSWATVRRDVRRPQLGRNVVLHELAHKLDASDGLLDGTPEIVDRREREAWVQVLTAEHRRLRRGRAEAGAVLRQYAARSPSELFAVATEVFFLRSLELQAERPALYDVLRRYYRQDPAARARGAGQGAGPGGAAPGPAGPGGPSRYWPGHPGVPGSSSTPTEFKKPDTSR